MSSSFLAVIHCLATYPVKYNDFQRLVRVQKISEFAENQ